MGVQIQCAQCHDHPNDPWKREQFHQFAAFFAGIRTRQAYANGQNPAQIKKAVAEAKAKGLSKAEVKAKLAQAGPRAFEVVDQPGRPKYTMPDLKDPQKQIPVAPRFFLASKSDAVPDRLPEKATQKKALEPHKPLPGMPPAAVEKKEEAPKKKAKPPTGLLKRTNETKDKNYWIYVPEDYDPNVSYAVVLWLHPVGKNKDTDIDDFKESWEDYCARNHIILADEPANREFFDAVASFLGDKPFRGALPGTASFRQRAQQRVAAMERFWVLKVIAALAALAGAAVSFIQLFRLLRS